MVKWRNVIPPLLTIANRREGLAYETLDSIAGMRRVPRL
jgi:hypothetical protein